MKYNFDWKHWLLFLVVSAGLLVITRSFLMSLGFMMLVLLIDRLLAEWDKNRSKKNGEERDK